MAQLFQIPFSSADISAPTSQYVAAKMDIMTVQGISYVYTGDYWLVIKDYNNNIIQFIHPNSNGDINFPEPITQYILLERNTELPPQTGGVSNPTLYIRFNGVQSTITSITSNINASGSSVIITNVPHVVVDSGHIDVDSVAGDVDVVNGSTPFHVEVDNFPATQDVHVTAALPAGGNTIGNVGIVGTVLVQQDGFSFANESTNDTVTLVTGAGMLHGVQINTVGVGSTVALYDSLTGSGTLIATIDTTVAALFQFDANVTVGLTYVTAGGTPADITILYR